MIHTWIASENHKESSSQTKNVTLNPKRVEKIGLGILLMYPSLVGIMVFKQKILLDWSIIIFQVITPFKELKWKSLYLVKIKMYLKFFFLWGINSFHLLL